MHERVERPQGGDLFRDAARGDVAADEDGLRAELPQLLGGLLGCGVVPEVADRDPLGAVPREAARDLPADPARAARHEDGGVATLTAGSGAGLSAGAELGICCHPGRLGDSRRWSSAFDEAWPRRSSRSIFSSA